ncbi:stress-responsive transcription factor hsf1 [Ascosphaera acerosa]|nr:stress-responsive transcription factor hsf1 [Ascosphaera acerosa]
MVPRSQISGSSTPSAFTTPSTLSDSDILRDGGDALGESDTAIEQRALLARKEALDKRRQIPPFVQKLMSFLNDERNTPYIRWSDDGNSFIVVDEDEFARTLIPEMFKHNKYPSFVRQLNMYGFHKKVRLSDNSMRAHERKNKSPSEYANPYFKRGRPDLLWLIQKPKGSQSSKVARNSEGRVRSEDKEDGDNEEGGGHHTGGTAAAGSGAAGGADESAQENRAKSRGQLALSSGDSTLINEQLASVYAELQTIRQQQQVIHSTINKVRREHEQLYHQAATFQEQHTRHENSINAILTFLATVYNRSLQGGAEGVQSLMNSFQNAVPQEHLQGSGNVMDMSCFNVTDVGSATPGQRSKKIPLLLKAAPSRASTTPRQGNTTASPPHTATSWHVHQRQPSVGSMDGGKRNIEELVDPTSPTYTANITMPSVVASAPRHAVRPSPTPLLANAGTAAPLPARDIVSMMPDAASHLPGTTISNHEVSPAEFSNMIAPMKSNKATGILEATTTSSSQPGEMLRMIANQASDNASQASNIHASASPTADMGVGYAGTSASVPGDTYSSSLGDGLASSRADIEKLVRLQTEQDRHVQNLTNLLQPLSPNGAIPGLSEAFQGSQVPQPAFDIDNIFNGDYFSTYPQYEATTATAPATNGATTPATTAVSDTTQATSGIAAPQVAGDIPSEPDVVDVDDLFNFDALSTPRMHNNYATGDSRPSDIAPAPSSTSEDVDRKSQKK